MTIHPSYALRLQPFVDTPRLRDIARVSWRPGRYRNGIGRTQAPENIEICAVCITIASGNFTVYGKSPFGIGESEKTSISGPTFFMLNTQKQDKQVEEVNDHMATESCNGVPQLRPGERSWKVSAVTADWNKLECPPNHCCFQGKNHPVSEVVG